MTGVVVRERVPDSVFDGADHVLSLIHISTPQIAQGGQVLVAPQSGLQGQAGGNMEGKETRFGIAGSALWASATTAVSNGSVNAMHDSFTPLGGMIPMVLMQLGEVVFGGVGSGLYGMLAFVLLTVFLAGLMVGRTPEYLGKKIEPFEMKMAVVVCLTTPVAVSYTHLDVYKRQWQRHTAKNKCIHNFCPTIL